MATLNTDIRYIKGVGEACAKSLAKLGITDLRSLLSYFPRAAFVNDAELDKVKPLANARELGLSRDDGADTAHLTGDEVGDFFADAAILVGAGKVGKEGA